MKAILEFNLPEDREEFEAAVKGLDNKTKIDTLYDEVFRPHLKYGKGLSGEELTEDEEKTLRAIWDEIVNHLEG